MSRGLRFSVQRGRRAARKAEVRALHPSARCFWLPDGSRVVAAGAEGLGRADTANRAWWAAWSALFPDRAEALAHPRRRPTPAGAG